MILTLFIFTFIISSDAMCNNALAVPKFYGNTYKTLETGAIVRNRGQYQDLEEELVQEPRRRSGGFGFFMGLVLGVVVVSWLLANGHKMPEGIEAFIEIANYTISSIVDTIT